MRRAAFHIRPALAFILTASLSPPPASAQSYSIRFDHYLNASGGTATPIMESGVLEETPSLYREFVYDGPAADNRAEVRYYADIARGRVGSYAFSTGDVVDVWPYVHTATGRVTDISFQTDLYFDVAAGSYPDPVVVSVAGEVVGSLSATLGASAMVHYSITFGETHSPPLRQIGIDEPGTIVFTDPFTLDKLLLLGGTVLAEPVRFTVRLTARIEDNWTSAVQGGVYPNVYTGSATVDVYDGLRFTEVIVPAGVTWSSPDDVFLSVTTDVEQLPPPKRLALRPSGPNPFTSATAMRFDLPVAAAAKLRIHDLAGRVIRTLVDGEMPAGSHAVSWDGRDDAGHSLASGVYIARLESGDRCTTLKLMRAR